MVKVKKNSIRLIGAIRYRRRLASTEPLASIINEEVGPGLNVQSDDALLDYLKRATDSNYHPVGTCRMGRDDNPTSVLTPDLKVKGVTGPRVFDAALLTVRDFCYRRFA
ncbi:GMC oxidoreductase [Paraburkholderia terrae]|uniref:GMC oxidoreductase n=1 Tax=Paraburkholderia terrae TaxID=311230 RepID=UPI00296B2EC4|nr:GMC oxidoreductase [Paraburkholderia terrae]MDW3662358.1 GMC oxidoreductase [Paraburkholderia terrae]